MVMNACLKKCLDHGSTCSINFTQHSTRQLNHNKTNQIQKISAIIFQLDTCFQTTRETKYYTVASPNFQGTNNSQDHNVGKPEEEIIEDSSSPQQPNNQTKAKPIFTFNNSILNHFNQDRLVREAVVDGNRNTDFSEDKTNASQLHHLNRITR